MLRTSTSSLLLARGLSKSNLIAHLRIPLYRNAYALIAGAVTTSGLGVAYWALAARYYSPTVVGLSSAVISAMMLLTGTTMLSLTGVLVRFIPVAGSATRRLILFAYLTSLLSTIVIGPLFLWAMGWWTPALAFLTQDPWWGGAFLLGTLIACLFTLQDSALTGLRQTHWIPLENSLFAVVKLGLLALFATLWPTWGIFAAWTLPMIAAVAPVNFFIFRYAQRDGPPARFTRSDLLRYMAGNYPGTLFYLASTTLLPLLVTQQAGVLATAYFFMPWMITTGLMQVALNMTTSLTVEATADQAHLGLYCYRALRQTARLVLPAVALIVVGASPILMLFGPDYAAEGALLLRLLALAALPNMLVMLYIGYARVKNQVGAIIFVQGAQALLLLGLSYLWVEQWGILSIGIALLISQSSVALFVLGTELRTVLRQQG